jgi:hypothetical protein
MLTCPKGEVHAEYTAVSCCCCRPQKLQPMQKHDLKNSSNGKWLTKIGWKIRKILRFGEFFQTAFKKISEFVLRNNFWQTERVGIFVV